MKTYEQFLAEAIANGWTADQAPSIAADNMYYQSLSKPLTSADLNQGEANAAKMMKLGGE